MARIRDLLAVQRTVSFEFFPPKSDQAATLLTNTMTELSRQRPHFVSITYGAGGSNRSETVNTVVAVETTHETTAMAHLTCIGHRVEEIDELLDTYAAAGVENILALGGDPLTGSDGELAPPSDFRYAAELVAHIKQDGRFSVGVAAHPEGHPRSPSMKADRQRLAEKLKEADFAVTQFFFRMRDYLSIVDDLAALGCDKPVIPGVIPLTNANQVTRFASMAGATIPPELIEQIETAANKGGGPGSREVQDLGVEVALKMSQELIEAGAPGLHFYTLNRFEATAAVLKDLGVSASK